ncbi:uncharacterized protein LOC128985652 [Macrosteles quadrilineatus]|uniref:uncharacterized protein LOC128985652 n=1 Tax=Macrosteles quadrilineatus TaxID=74068 RepID=UPI0023E20353|nr:uncharacterized protein LOC128985652 [Macrosteles quadrilineatus]
MDTNTIIEGTVKFRDGKKWKSRWCVVRKLSPVADCVHLQLYRDCKERYKQGQTKASLSLENFLGVQSGFTLDKESNTLAIICQELTVVLAFDTREHLMQWQVKITSNLGEGDQWLVQICSAPAKAKLPPGPARLLLQEYQFCLTVGVPPRLINFWQISQLRKFGVIEGKFCFEGGSRCGRGEGLYILVSERPEDLARAFHLAADGKLFTNKRSLSRNSSVMDKSRKHHTLRPDSRMSDGSSLESTLESPAGCNGSHSREDLLSWSQHPMCDLGDTVSNSDSAHRFDLKSLWTPETPMARCTSCMSKLGSMSRSSTLTHTPAGFPAWTMDRPKSYGSQKVSPSVTCSCSSVSLSSHSSRGSRHSSSATADCHPLCSANGNMCPCASKDHAQAPPLRPPKPPHLSFLRLQSTPSSTTSDCPSPLSSLRLSLSPSPSCCCGHQGGALSPFGNYDVPKPLNVQRRLKLNFNNSPVKTLSQSSDEFYDTPRKLKDSLIWEYGNYDVPPPAQPLSPESVKRESLDESQINNDSRDPDQSNEDTLPFHINKVKLTGQGRMPVMSPCGKIIEKPEPSYEEKLDQLLENDHLSSDVTMSSNNYMNVDSSQNNNPEKQNIPEENMPNNNVYDPEQNYTNIAVVQSLQNYENILCFLPEDTKTNSLDQSTNGHLENKVDSEEKKNNDPSETNQLCCSNCGHVCSKTIKNQSLNDRFAFQPANSNTLGKSKNENHLDFLSNKYNSTSCLQEGNLDSHYCCEKSTSEDKAARLKSLLKCSVSASNSPQLKRPPANVSEADVLDKFHLLSLRKRSNSADSTRFHVDEESVNDTASTDGPGKSYFLSNPSSSDSLCVADKLDSPCKRKDIIVNKCELKLAPLVITENTDILETSSEKCTKRCARRSSSVPNKFFSNRDSSSSNDSGVSTGSLSLKHFGAEFLEFEMPLTTSMSSKRHHIAMLNHNGDVTKPKMLPKRSKSVDPMRELTFTFDDREHQSAKSTSAEAEVPVFLNESGEKDYLSPLRATTYLHDSRSTSSATSDISDYIETLSYSSYSSLDPPDNLRNGKAMALTLKPRSGKEYQQIDRNLLDQVSKS